MATSEENDLIGYDPLAWMEGSVDTRIDKSEDQLQVVESKMIEDFPEDLLEDSEESELLSDEPDDESSDDDIDHSSAVIDEGLEEEDAAPDAQIDLDATLTIQHVGALHEQLKNSLSVHDQIEINASDVASIDTATLQLLVSLKKDAAKLQKQVSIIYPSPRFIESAQLLGLLDVLEVVGFD